MLHEYKKAFVAFSTSEEIRTAGSSGGIGTQIASFLLGEKIVDAIIGVGFDAQDPKKPAYRIIRCPEETQYLSGSKYVYMPLRPLLDLAGETKSGKLAVFSQPCHVPALLKKLPQTTLIFSIFCGYNITYAATEYLIKKTGMAKNDIQHINYRGGKYPGGFTVTSKSGRQKSFGKEHYELIDLLFLNKKCGACRSYISEQADIALGDAWIKNFPKATLVIINTERGENMVRHMHAKKMIELYGISRDDIIRMHGHNLRYKKHGHSLPMKMVIKAFNNPIARKIAPFRLLGFLSRIRRQLKIGIDLDMRPVEEV